MSPNANGLVFIENSDIVKHTVTSLLNVASEKTSVDYARSSLKHLLRDLEDDFAFLKYVNIKTLKKIDNNYDAVNVDSDMDDVLPKDIGLAIQELVDVLKTHLGSKAGYFFIKEFRDDLGDEYHTYIRDLGVDLKIAELKSELGNIDVKQYTLKEDSASNIAFIQKK